MPWPHKTAVVTGIARPTGIGHACALLLFRQGYSIVGIDCHQPHPTADTSPNHLPWTTLQHQQQQQQGSGASTSQCVFLQVDLSQPAAIQALPQQLQGLGVRRVKTLVSNAGIADPFMPPPAADGSNAAQRAELWSKYIAVNLSAPFLLSEALLPLMMPAQEAAAAAAAGEQNKEQQQQQQQQASSIIHIASTRALQSEPNSEGYAAAKAGLLGLTHAQAASLAGSRVRVNAVLPGWIHTGDDALGSMEPPPAAAGGIGGVQEGVLRPQDHAWHWVGRVGVPGDVAEVVGFLADEARSGFITGQEFVVDGGVTRRMTYPE